MSKVYNTQQDIARGIEQFLLKVFPDIRKTQLKIIPFIIFGMIQSESTVASDIAKKPKDDFSLIQADSVIKRIRRFFKNKLFNPYLFYHKIISHVIKNYKKKHSDKRVHIVFDHMFSHDNYTVFMITMRIGKQGIPLWFRCFKSKHSTNAFKTSLINEGISYVSTLFDNDFQLIFLADRAFDYPSILKHIEFLGHTYCIRLRKNRNILIYDKKEEHYIWKRLDELQSYEYHSIAYNNVYYTEEKYKFNIVISKRHDVNEPWIIATNGDTRWAVKDYGYRFGAIECLFKSQKSNGFRLECTTKATLKYFETLYTLVCVSSLFLTILGADYNKNTKCYKNTNIKTHYTSYKSNTRVRTISLFNTGLLLFNIAFNSLKYIRLTYNFILYDT